MSLSFTRSFVVYGRMHRARTGQGRIAHYVAGEATTVAACLGKHFRLQPEQVSDLLALGAVYQDKRRVFADRELPKGAYLRIHLAPKRFPVQTVNWKDTVRFTHRDFLVVEKPAGVPAHATLDNIRENVLQQLRDLTGENLLITQRLDTPVAGLMVIARTAEFQRVFNRYLAERQVQKRYRALTDAPPPRGFHVHYMEPSERSPRRLVPQEKPGWDRCELTVHEVKDSGIEGVEGLADSSIELHTGRTHQIRAQLAALGAPIAGDRLYGSRRRAPGIEGRERIGLYSAECSWPNPRGEAWRFKLDPPWARSVSLADASTPAIPPSDPDRLRQHE